MNHELKPQQYYPLYQEEDVPLIDVRQSVLRKWIWGTVFLLVAFLTLGFIIRFPNQITVPFIIKSSQPKKIYQFSHTVFVLDKKVSEQDRVYIGQRLVKITSPEIVELLASIQHTESDLAYHLQQAALATHQQEAIFAAQAKSFATQQERQQQARSILKNAFDSEMATLAAKEDHARKQYTTNKKLYEFGTVAQIELEETKQSLIAATNQLNITRNNYQKQFTDLAFGIRQAKEERQKLNEEINKLNIDYDNTTIALQEKIRLAKSKLAQNYGDYDIDSDGIWLKAEMEGMVAFLFSGDKEVIAGTPLLQLGLRPSTFYALATISPQQIGQIQTDGTAVLKVATFPHYEWGVLRGTIAPLPLSPNKQGDFPVKIHISDFGQLQPLLQVGMGGEVAILIEERSFFGYLTKNIQALYYEVVD